MDVCGWFLSRPTARGVEANGVVAAAEGVQLHAVYVFFFFLTGGWAKE